MHTAYLVSALFCFILLPLHAQKAPEEFRAEAGYDAHKRELVIKVTATERDISIVQLSISRPYADDGAVEETKDFALYVVPLDESDTKEVRALASKANKEVRLYRGKFPINAGQTTEIRLPAKKAPDQKSRIIVGAELFRSEGKVGVYLAAKVE